MFRLRIILFLFFLLFVVSCKQRSAAASSEEIKNSKKFNGDHELNHDTAFLRMLSRVYRDSALTMADSISRYFAFMAAASDSSVAGHGEFVSSKFKVEFPIKAIGWVNDFESVYTRREIMELDSIINDFERETSVEIAIVTIDSSWISAERFDGLTFAIANEWGVGKKGVNNGILIGISKGLRVIRIQNGYGIETTLTDAETKNILEEYILPDFRNGRFFQGTKSGLLAIMRELR
jgi:uncharacterized protein